MLVRQSTYNIIKRTYKNSTICFNLFKDFNLDDNSHKPRQSAGKSQFEKFNRFRTHSESQEIPRRQERWNRSDNKRSNRDNNRPRKFFIHSGTESCQNAIRSIVLRVQEISPDFKVQYLNPETNSIEVLHLADIVNSIDLTKQGITCVELEDNYPLVKLCKVHEMTKVYSDKLAKIKEQELLAMGSKKTAYAIQSREKALSKRSAEKVISCKWSINTSDLLNQKKNEILKRLSKGENLQVRFQTNSNRGFDTDSSHVSHMHRNEDDYNLELKKRKLVKQTIESVLDELPCTWSVDGDIETKCAYRLTAQKKKQPMEPEEDDRGEKVAAKRTKSKDTKSKQKEQKQTTKSEEDLDALYSFKIED